jgi:hypothetical protein
MVRNTCRRLASPARIILPTTGSPSP